MSIQPNDVLILRRKSFDYSLVDEAVAEDVRAAGAFIRDRVRMTIKNIVVIGLQLHEVKSSLLHGQFGAWLKAEFDWTRRTANNYMAVADWLGDKTETVSHFPITPTAAYMLSACSTSQAAREAALERAKAGEEITHEIAREIVNLTRIQDGQRHQGRPAHRMRAQLARLLDQCQETLPAKTRSEFAQQLREAAAALEGVGTENQKPLPE